MTLWIDCDGVDELVAKVEAAGVEIIKRPFDGPFGRTAICVDPNGCRIRVNENPWGRIPLGGKH